MVSTFVSRAVEAAGCRGKKVPYQSICAWEEFWFGPLLVLEPYMAGAFARVQHTQTAPQASCATGYMTPPALYKRGACNRLRIPCGPGTSTDAAPVHAAAH